jgi:zinc transport system ATP-binding protein
MSRNDSPPKWALQLEDLSFAYGRTEIFDRADLNVKPGQFACIVGPNGGGKTTLLKLVLGLLRPDTGSIRVLGTSPVKARSHVGYVPQHLMFDSQFPMSVMDVALMGRLGSTRWIGPYRRKDRRAVRDALARVDLAGLAGEQFGALSGGQRQRVLIARCLGADPKLLLLDEPTANLDAEAEQSFLELLQRLNRDEGLTILLVSHDVGFVTEMVSTVICVNHQISVHPTAALTGETISALYNQEIRLVRHRHDCLVEGCEDEHD